MIIMDAAAQKRLSDKSAPPVTIRVASSVCHAPAGDCRLGHRLSRLERQMGRWLSRHAAP